ncbi:hypothetical protein N7462_000004 [Penicillium macrosclerotiorum]|uniref:uncharacterized protein n=1 Tax=Penicillium macrosclerotiorum TaxID=303699 RepID=UPI0025486DA1|nr:uncharacterized protein N7462_000004 [Penicillium macrosclerotiorum]KAJ5697999.1 hypothetical protein N7462_000004 [Penicillium macrosclerotiorum]
MSDDVSATPKKTRSSKPKVRTGCITCKARRVKCDETKPACVRCTTTGRRCDGYAPLKTSFPEYKALAPARTTDASDTTGSSSSSASRTTQTAQLVIRIRPEYRSLAPLADPSQADLTPKERWFLVFFRHVTARTNAKFFGEEFWGRLVHQASEVQPAVRHSAIGISALHWDSLAKYHSVRGDQDPSFALHQCSKAFAYLQANFGASVSRRQRMEAVLISCGILLSFAFGQGDARACGCHIRSGLGLLHGWQRLQMDNSPVGLVILKSFSQLHLDWLPLVGPDGGLENYSYPLHLAVNYQPNIVVETPEDACGILLILGWLTLQMKPQRLPGQPVACASSALLQRLDHWKALILNRSGALSQQNRETIAILDVWREVVLIKFLTDGRLEEGEMRYDDHLPHFERTVELGRYLTNGALSSSWAWSAIVTPLFFCAFKCRDWTTRREALDVLLAWRHEQGIWSLSGPALVLKRLIEIESKDYKSHEVIAEVSRIDAVHVDFPSGNTKHVRFWYRKPAPSDQICVCDAAQVWNNHLIPY